MILVNAENVSPTEVEYCLEAHPQVMRGGRVRRRRCADRRRRLRGGGDRCLRGRGPVDLTAWSRSTLAHYKVPTHWLVVHEPLPRTASGKLVKREIRRLVEQAPHPSSP